MVVNISKVLSGDWDYVAAEIKDLTAATHAGGAKDKGDLRELLSERSRRRSGCARSAASYRRDWVKTSTGYGTRPAQRMEDLRLMRKHSPANVQVKAAGGVRDLDALLAVRDIGVTRVGATRTITMLEECRKRLGLPALEAAHAAPHPAGY